MATSTITQEGRNHPRLAEAVSPVTCSPITLNLLESIQLICLTTFSHTTHLLTADPIPDIILCLLPLGRVVPEKPFS